jgi:putative nucleotidyltransferase with HDIG domain
MKMRIRTSEYVTLIVLAAAMAASSLALWGAPPPPDSLEAVVLLGALALVAEVLGYLLPRGARGSLAFIPYLAAALIVPTWQTVVAAILVKALVEAHVRNAFEKAVFNVAQYALNISVAIWVYMLVGGESLLTLPQRDLLYLTKEVGFASIVAFFVSFNLNSTLVSTAIAISSGSSVKAVWKANTLPTVGIDILASPLVFMFAWVYVRFGPIAASALWVPIVGLREVHKAILELELTNRELLELMVKSIEARDRYTSGHSRRVQYYSVIIARAVGLAERDVEMVSRAALLHDVGKIHEKYGPILVKADKLTAQEWATMREHPADGADLIATMTRLRELVSAVRHHHENWDGTGYPDGLAGELIPQAARIIRFADTVDAMTSQRPYRQVLAENEVRAEIVRCRGTQFDPHIADRLLSSPLWPTMFAPGEASQRLGTMVVLPTARQRVAGRS